MAAHASALRTAALGGVEGIVDDEAADPTMANLGNPAGLAWLPRETRLDAAYGRDVLKQDVVVGQMTNEAHRVGQAGGPYELFTRIGTRNAWQLGVDGGWDKSATRARLSAPGAGNTLFADVPEFMTFFDAQARFAASYARRVTDTLAIGGWWKPLGGVVGLPSLDNVERSISFSLNDWSLGGALRLPVAAGWGDMAAGFSLAPFDDRPDLRDALDLVTGSAKDLTDVGAYAVTQTLTFSNSVTQTWKTYPRGTTLALQGTWASPGGAWDAAAAAERTAADATQENSTSRLLPGGVSLVQRGLASDFARTRFRIAARHRRDLGGGGQVRYAASVLTERSVTDKLDFPDSEAVTATRTSSPLELGAGVAYRTKAGHSVGAGWSGRTERQTVTDAATNVSETASHSATTGRLGWEYLFTPRWTGRLGAAWTAERSRSGNAGALVPGSDPRNPVRRDRVLSAGAQFHSAWRTRGEAGWWWKALSGLTPSALEALAVTHALTQSPEPTPGQPFRRSRDEVSLAARWDF